MEFKEQMNMILCNFNGVNFVALLQANIFEDQLTILFNLLIVEYPVSILRHQHDVVSDLTIATAKTAQFQCYHILAIDGWHHLWLKCREHPHLKEVMYYRFKRAEKRARVHFISDLKVGVFVTIRAPIVISAYTRRSLGEDSHFLSKGFSSVIAISQFALEPSK